MADDTRRGRPAQYAQASRKGKKAWRKNIDLSATEAALEDAREQERQEGVPAYKRADADLFVEDRGGQETSVARQARPARKLKSQEILAQRSAVPAMHQRARADFHLGGDAAEAKMTAAGVPPKLKRRLRMLASRPHEGAQGADERGHAGKLQSDAVLAGKYDVWGAPSAPPRANEWLEPAQKTKIHKPRSMAHEPLAEAKAMPAVDVPHPGASYNPDFASHDELIQAAYEQAKAAELDEEATRALMQQWQGVQRGKPTLGVDLDVDDGAGESDADADADADAGAEEAADDAALSARHGVRKTQAQRRREARAKAQYVQAQQRRKERQIRAMMAEMPAHMKHMRREAQTRAAIVMQRRQAKAERLRREGLAGERVGKYTVPRRRVDVQTGDELSESLRQLRPEGNLFRDRLQSLQARGLVEARQPVQPKRGLRTKVYDRHTFKRD